MISGVSFECVAEKKSGFLIIDPDLSRLWTCNSHIQNAIIKKILLSETLNQFLDFYIWKLS